jgi:hypothetical protein
MVRRPIFPYLHLIIRFQGLSPDPLPRRCCRISWNFITNKRFENFSYVVLSLSYCLRPSQRELNKSLRPVWIGHREEWHRDRTSPAAGEGQSCLCGWRQPTSAWRQFPALLSASAVEPRVLSC